MPRWGDPDDEWYGRPEVLGHRWEYVETIEKAKTMVDCILKLDPCVDACVYFGDEKVIDFEYGLFL